jgi:hypothetical protein
MLQFNASYYKEDKKMITLIKKLDKLHNFTKESDIKFKTKEIKGYEFTSMKFKEPSINYISL